jgi:hypothetical protein
MPEPTMTKRGPGRPRKGLVKVTLSLRPEQVATLRIYALHRLAFSERGPVRPDLSEAVRALIMEPAVSAVLRRSFDAFQEKLDELAGPVESEGPAWSGRHHHLIRLVSGVLDGTLEALGRFPLDDIADESGKAPPAKKAPPARVQRKKR